MTPGEPWRLTALEVACGFPIGLDPDAPSLPPSVKGEGPLAALERAVLPALQRSPCLVSFSGGRDSSAVLAVATAVARREELPPPVPVTLRFPAAPEADEAEWQQAVVRHLGIDDWVCVELQDELDLVGPVASRVHRRHGLLWPPNTHFHVPVLEMAKGGCVLTGIDGDGLLASWRWARPAGVLARRVRPEPRDVLRLGLAVQPRPLRRVVESRLSRPDLPWLRPQASRAVSLAWAADRSREPFRWDRRVRWWSRLRSLRMVLRSLDLVAERLGTRVVHPLADPRFLAAAADAGGRLGLGDRTAVMRSWFGPLLPGELIARPTKARLDGPFWATYSRAFIASWDGEGVDEALVDPLGLRRAWCADVPNAFTSTLLQAAWLASDAGGHEEGSGPRHVQEPVDGAGERGPVPGAGQPPRW